MPPAVKRTVSVPSGVLRHRLAGVEEEGGGVLCRLGREVKHHVHGLLLKGAEGAPGVALQIEAGDRA